MPPDPGYAILLWCTESASFLEAVGAKMHPVIFFIDLASKYATASFL
jgi:hypothetical protein